MNKQLKTLLRRPILMILLILLLGTISFGFISKVVEYSAIDNVIEETSKYYRSIGYLTNKNPETSDVTEGARILMESDEISFYEVLRRCTGTLDEIYNSDYNSSAGDMAQSNISEVLFWGDLVDMYFRFADPEKHLYKDTYTLKFHVSDPIYGYPEYVSEDRYLMIDYYPDEENDSFAEIYDTLELNKTYGVKAYHVYQEGMVLRQVLDDETWFLTEDQTLEMKKIKEADAVQDTNRHRVWVLGGKRLKFHTKYAGIIKNKLSDRWALD